MRPACTAAEMSTAGAGPARCCGLPCGTSQATTADAIAGMVGEGDAERADSGADGGRESPARGLSEQVALDGAHHFVPIPPRQQVAVGVERQRQRRVP